MGYGYLRRDRIANLESSRFERERENRAHRYPRSHARPGESERLWSSRANRIQARHGARNGATNRHSHGIERNSCQENNQGIGRTEATPEESQQGTNAFCVPGGPPMTQLQQTIPAESASVQTLYRAKKPHIPVKECGVALQSGYFRGLGLCFAGFTGQTSLTHRTSSSISFLELPKVLKRVTGSPVFVRICTTNFPCPDKTRATCEYCGKPNRLSPFDRGMSITETKLRKTGLVPFSCREISCRTLERPCNIC